MRLPDPTAGLEAFLEGLETLVRRQRHDLLLPGTDASLYAISRGRLRLEPYVRVGLPDHETVERALNKAVLADCAASVGLASPDSEVCAHAERAVEVADSFGYPVLVKPVRTVVETDGRLVRRDSRLASDASQVRAAVGRLGQSIVQHRRHGDLLSFAGVAGDRSMLGAVVSRYRRTWPAEAGSVSYSETVAVSEQLSERVLALVSAIGWKGLFELELIESADGRTEAIDFNPRPYGSLALARAAGVALVTIWCRSALGQPDAPSIGRPGARYRWEDGDFRHLLGQIRADRRLAALELSRARVAHAYFQPSDPAPAMARGAELTRNAILKARARRGAG